jgi:hypothetical protein
MASPSSDGSPLGRSADVDVDAGKCLVGRQRLSRTDERSSPIQDRTYSM